MFSVIIPLYNKEKYIEKAILSVLDQTYNNYEIIVVDDGSTDKGSEKALKLLKKRHHLVNIRNSGVSTARNTGAQLAKYSFLAFLDADDWWEPNFLKEMKKLISDYPDASLYSSNFFKVKNKKQYASGIGFDNNFACGYINYFKIYNRNYRQLIYPSSCIIRKAAFENKKGFHPKITRGEDFHLWVKLALSGKVAYCNKYLSNYYQDSEVAERATKKLHSPQSNYVFFFDEFKSAEESNQEIKKLFNHIRWGNYMRYIIKNKYVDEAKKLIENQSSSAFLLFERVLLFFPVTIQRYCFKLIFLKRFFKRKLQHLINPLCTNN